MLRSPPSTSSIMSCNGCRVLRKGCSDSCILRPCLQWIETPEAQGHATVFVAKFFGRAGLMSFISAVPDSQRPVLFQSLLFEACGRTVNPVNGAVGLLWTGNCQVCQAAVETVLRGGSIRPIPELVSGLSPPLSDEEEADVSTVCTDMWRPQNCGYTSSRSKTASCSPTISKRKRSSDGQDPSTMKKMQHADLDLRLTPTLGFRPKQVKRDSRRLGSPSMNSEESAVTTSCFESNGFAENTEMKLLNLFP